MSVQTTITVTVQLFAGAREAAGRGTLDVVLSDNGTIGQLRRALSEQHPQLAALAPHLMFAIDTRYADDHTAVAEHAQVAAIPPVSGG
ncbi:MAG TPA: MoaD/ThiS family protein [Pirellulales bacterium]|jgi:molybdopterin converting factor small subunit|nr:MoaD/ThiS family protein [Pirellulales bacterium]